MRQEQSQTEKAYIVNQLASGIAHDFKNLLRGARTCSDLIAEGLPPNDEFQELFKQVDSSLESAEQLAHSRSCRIPDRERNRTKQQI